MPFRLIPVDPTAPPQQPQPFGSASDNLLSGTQNVTTPMSQAPLRPRQFPVAPTASPVMADSGTTQGLGSLYNSLTDAEGNPATGIAYPPPIQRTPFALAETLDGTDAEGTMPDDSLSGMAPGSQTPPLPTAGGANLYAPQAQRAPFAQAPQAPSLRALPEYDPNKRGMEKTALIGGLAGFLFGGGQGAIAGATKAAGAFGDRRTSDYTREAQRVAKDNETAQKGFDSRLKSWETGEKVKEGNYQNQIRQDQNILASQDRRISTAQRREAALGTLGLGKAKLGEDIRQFGEKTRAEKLKILNEFDQFVYKEAGLFSPERQAMIGELRNGLAESLKVGDLQEVPGMQRPDGSVVPAYSLSASGINARSNEAIGNANIALAGVRKEELPKQTAIAQERLNFDELNAAVDKALKMQQLAQNSSHQNRMAGVAEGNLAIRKATDELKKANDSGGVKPLTPAQRSAVEKELSMAATTIGDLKRKAKEPTRQKDEPVDKFQGRIAEWKEHRRQNYDSAEALRKLLDQKARSIGWEGDGKGGYKKAFVIPENWGEPAETVTPNPNLPGGGLITPGQNGQAGVRVVPTPAGGALKKPTLADLKYTSKDGGTNTKLYNEDMAKWNAQQKRGGANAPQGNLPKGVKKRADGSYDMSSLSKAQLDKLMTTGKL